MKNLLNLEGVKTLSKMEQKSINGGYEQEYACYCNGVYVGAGESASECASACYACVTSGGC